MVFRPKTQRVFIPLIVCIVTVVLDQWSKAWILQELGPEPAMKFKPLIGDWFRLVYSQNTGIAFNFFPDMSPIFIVTSTLISALVIYAYLSYLPNHQLIVQICIGLILGGAVGNTLDRIFHNFVIDFIQVGWWPVFNVADMTISTGAILLAIYLTLLSSVEPAPTQPQDEALLNDLLNREVEKREPQEGSG